MITDLPDANDDEASKNNEKNMEEKISKIMMEYNYLMGTQLEEQRKFFEEKVNKLQNYLDFVSFSIFFIASKWNYEVEEWSWVKWIG